MISARAGFLMLTPLLAASDFAGKALARWGLRHSDLELGPFLALRLRFNEGSTFGLLSAGPSNWFVAVVVALVAIFGWWYAPRGGWSVALGAALVTAGGIGNVVDRSLQGRVTDFVAVRIGQLQSPIFNLADIFLVLGVLFLVWPHRAQRA